MTEENIYTRLNDIFREIFANDSIVLQPHTTARDIDGWDSGRMIDIIMATEEAFSLRFTAREVDSLRQVSDFVAAIARKTERPV